MKMRLFATLLLLLAVLAALAAPRGHVQLSGKVAPWVVEHTAYGAQAEFLIVLSEQADLSGAQALPAKLDKGRYVRDALWNTAQATQPPLRRWLEARGVEYRPYYIVNLIWARGDAQLVSALAARPDVARIEGNPQISIFHSLPSTFHLPLSTASIEPNLAYVHAPQVWDMGFTGQGIVIGGQDTGYDWDHPALRAQYRGWGGASVNHDYNWHDSIHSGGGICGSDSPEPCDDYGHGTHTMGTAVGDDGGINRIGVAPGAKWIGCRNMNQGVGSPAAYLECFEFFLAPYPVNGSATMGDPAQAPDVTINSWTCPSYEGCSWDVLQAAVEAQRAAGIMTVAAAGNSGSACSSVREPPAVYDAAYTVGALNPQADTAASFSGRGPVVVDGSSRRKPDIAAPGVNIRSSLPDGGYGYNLGTSMATPHVAGAAALLWSAHPGLKNQIAATEHVLNSSAVHIPSADCGSDGWPNNTYGYGRLDVRAAVCLSPTLEAGFAWAPPLARTGQVVTFTAIISGGAKPLSYTWSLAPGSLLLPGGAVATHTFAAAGAYTVTLQVGDACGARAAARRQVEVMALRRVGYLPLVLK